MASVMRLVFSVLGQVQSVMEKHKERERKLYSGLKSLKIDMDMVAAFLRAGDQGFHGALQETRLLQLQELAYDVEDFVVSLPEPGNYGCLRVATGTDHRPQLLESIEGFNSRLTSLQKEWKLSDESGKNREDPDDDAAGSCESPRCKDPEVIDAPKKKLLELLSTSPAELRVISIVGCRGVGKTALARAVYEDDDVCSQFGCVAWFEVSGCKNEQDLLCKAPENGRTEAGGAAAAAATATITSLRDLPADTRYLVFVNDVQQPHMWKETVRHLSEKCEKSGRRSRIIMTTSVHSVSTACSSGSYVYRMQCLGQDESEALFWRKVYGCQSNPPRGSPLDEGSKSIFSKCDGLPLALSSVAKYLGANADRLERRDCEEMGRDLGAKYLSGDHDVFRKMRRSLVQCCRRLPDYDHRACLLYLSVFPRAHHIKNKSLVRRLMAEGLVATAQDGSECVNMLIDQCIVDAVQFSSDSRDAKGCRVHGIVLEYIIQKSVSKNIVTLIQEEGMQRVDSTVARVRRLSIQSSNQGTPVDEVPTGVSLSDVRSLTTFNSVPDFQSCKMLRLLDLEGCTWAANDSKCLDGICGLFLLKYLSLRKTGVKKLPTQMEKLQHLETLDIRETEVEKLPLEVIMLRKLAYLFGKFELPDVPKVTNTVYDFLTKTSELHTIAGFVVDRRTRGLEQLILQAPKLKKVKVWCNDTSGGVPMSGCPAHVLAPASSASASASASASCSPQRKRKICTLGPSRTKEQTLNQNVTVDRADETGTSGNIILLPKKCFTSLESVSMVSSALCKGFLGSLKGTCKISSIKLWGKLDRLPDSTELHYLDKINKLQLISSGLISEHLVALQKLPGLEYLKIVEDGDIFSNGIFKVEKDGFRSLKRLCIKAPSIPRLQFVEGAMGFVISLHLLCPDSSQTELAAGNTEGFSHLTRLNDVVLHASTSNDAIQAWETVANGHPKRPSVVKLEAE